MRGIFCFRHVENQSKLSVTCTRLSKTCRIFFARKFPEIAPGTSLKWNATPNFDKLYKNDEHRKYFNISHFDGESMNKLYRKDAIRNADYKREAFSVWNSARATRFAKIVIYSSASDRRRFPSFVGDKKKYFSAKRIRKGNECLEYKPTYRKEGRFYGGTRCSWEGRQRGVDEGGCRMDAAAGDGSAIHFRSESEFQLLSEPQILETRESRLLNLNLRY